MKTVLALTALLTLTGTIEAREHKFKHVPTIKFSILRNKALNPYEAIPLLLKRTDADRQVGRDYLLKTITDQSPVFYKTPRYLKEVTLMVDQYVDQVEGGDYDYVAMQMKVLLDDIRSYKREKKAEDTQDFTPRLI